MNTRAICPTYVQYGMLTSDQWKRFAVCEVNLPLTGDPSLTNTPSDGRMGALVNGKQCETCGHRNLECPGHFGYINLEEPIFNKLFLSYTLKILQCICPYCSHSRLKPELAEIQNLTVKTDRKRFASLVKILSDITRCPYGCPNAIPSYCIDKDEIKEYATVKNQRAVENKKQGVPCKASNVYNIFHKITKETRDFLGLNASLGDNRVFQDVAEGDHVHEFLPEALIYLVFPVIPPSSRCSPLIIA